jgi:hypothetical protein
MMRLTNLKRWLVQVLEVVTFPLEVGFIFYCLYILNFVPFLINFPQLIRDLWRSTPSESKIPMASYALVIWLACMMMLFFIWFLQQLYKFLVLRQQRAYFAAMFGTSILPGVILFSYFFAYFLIKK